MAEEKLTASAAKTSTGIVPATGNFNRENRMHGFSLFSVAAGDAAVVSAVVVVALGSSSVVLVGCCSVSGHAHICSRFLLGVWCKLVLNFSYRW